MLVDERKRSLLLASFVRPPASCHLYLKKGCKQPIRLLQMGPYREQFPRKHPSLGVEKTFKSYQINSENRI